MGCATVIITRVGNGVAAAYSPVSVDMGVSFTPAYNRLCADFRRQESGVSAKYSRSGKMVARFGLVCATNLGDGYLFASDALLITIENGKLIVKQR